MYKVGDLVSMTSSEFLKLAKLGLILKMPVNGRTVEWSKACNDYIVHEPDGRAYKLKPGPSEFLFNLNFGGKYEVVRPVGGIILKRKPIWKLFK